MNKVHYIGLFGKLRYEVKLCEDKGINNEKLYKVISYKYYYKRASNRLPAFISERCSVDEEVFDSSFKAIEYYIHRITLYEDWRKENENRDEIDWMV